MRKLSLFVVVRILTASCAALMTVGARSKKARAPVTGCIDGGNSAEWNFMFLLPRKRISETALPHLNDQVVCHHGYVLCPAAITV